MAFVGYSYEIKKRNSLINSHLYSSIWLTLGRTRFTYIIDSLNCAIIPLIVRRHWLLLFTFTSWNSLCGQFRWQVIWTFCFICSTILDLFSVQDEGGAWQGEEGNEDMLAGDVHNQNKLPNQNNGDMVEPPAKVIHISVLHFHSITDLNEIDSP